MLYRFLFFIAGCLCSETLFSQIDKFNSTDLHPVSPTAFQFVKYAEIPVSEYTGLPGITVPLYDVKVDEVTIPLSLSYHAQGIRVSQEASWVGLGWDLSFGSIVQTINDRDDYGYDPLNPSQPNVKRLPDFFPSAGDGNPTTLPPRYNYPFLTNGPGWSNPYPVFTPVFQQGFALAHKQYVPVDGQFDLQEWDLFNRRWYDSEPDVFVANFLGHSVKFSLDFDNNNARIILNKGGYDVFKTTNGFEIVSPAGTHFFFEVTTVIQNKTSSSSIEGSFSSPTWEDVSKIFFLSKIVTIHGKEINFSYTTTAETESYPSYSEKFQAVTSLNVISGPAEYGIAGVNPSHFYGTLNGNGAYASRAINKESVKYVNAITFPGGSVAFTLADRTDITNGKKLTTVQLKNSSLAVKKEWQLNYDYFDASAVSGNGYGYYSGDVSLAAETRSAQRLKLLNVTETGGGIYSFTYNSTALPKKNSFAQDYWGFYNGKLTNTSLALNPATTGYPALGNTGVDREPDLNYAKAGMLEEIQYPTKGKTKFIYEFNTFNSSRIAGYAGTANTNLPGAGLRVQEIQSYDNIYATAATRTSYTYEGGKYIPAARFARQFPYRRLYAADINGFIYYDYMFVELSANGVFSSAPYASVNGVGYDKVIKRQLDLSGVAIGRVETFFENYEDTYNPTIPLRALNCNIPTVKDNTHHENGSVKTIMMYDAGNNLVKKVVNTYETRVSPLLYGARIMGYGGKYYLSPTSGGAYELLNVEMNIIGYYPVFDVNTLLTKTETSDYQGANELTTNVARTFDNFDQLTFEQTRGSANEYLETYYSHPYDDLTIAGSSSLFTAHRYTEVVKARKVRRKSNYYESMDISEAKRLHGSINGHLVPTQQVLNDRLSGTLLPVVTDFSAYDDQANLTQFTENNTMSSLIWDYDKRYVTCMVKNAALSDIAYTSFESQNTGGWVFSGTPVQESFAPTGQKVYALSAGSLSRSGLATATYIVTYWKKSGSALVNGSSGTLLQTQGLWSLYLHKLNVTGGTVTLSGTASVDEIRLYPSTATMTTYTYEPFTGMTSQCDPNNIISYFEYDVLGRLSLVRDQERKIVKKICYTFSGQAEVCGDFNSSPVWQSTGNLRCQACPSNASYTTNMQEHEERDVNPNSATLNSTRWVSDGIPGSCTNNCPAPCTPLNCTGNNKKCVNGVCETGTPKCISSVNNGGKTWTCTWKYCFSDGTLSSYSYTTSGTSACPVQTCN